MIERVANLKSCKIKKIKEESDYYVQKLNKKDFLT